MMLAITFGLDDVVVSTFVQQPGHPPWPVHLFSTLLRIALRPAVAAMSTLMLVLTLVLSALVLRRSGRMAPRWA
ncbi:hypothetical protein [Gordonia oryzae]|uniref:hypothetical protein n=1 Tax=Gordonia oryzae TaxID=2487349 RepID=UPI001FE99B57|nr:hypothetical protein [Gordonia oryzae]